MPIRRVEVSFEPQLPSAHCVEWDFVIEPYLMGGGAKPREHDAGGPVRGPSVLGHVRWFWRLLHHDQPFERLRLMESERFGGLSRRDGEDVPIASPFSLEIHSNPGKQVPESQFPKMTAPLGYLLFSGREDKQNKAANLSEGVRGQIRLRGEIHEEVLRAFRLWSLLGGVGARTRRGIGAIQISNGPATAESLGTTIRDLLGNAAPVTKTATGIRGLRAVWIGKSFSTAKDCLTAIESWYRSYRQHRRPGTPPRPGRSYWDEPEEIRNLVGRRASRHKALLPTTVHPNGWARAALGLPIVFQFKDARENDPESCQLQGREYDRMASPLLFRPVRLTAGSYVPVVVLLGGPYEPAGGLELKSGKRSFSVALTGNPDRVFNDLMAAGGSLSLRQIL